MTDKTFRMESDKGNPLSGSIFIGGGDEKNMVLASKEEADEKKRL